jgi:hypothetical protein
MRHKVATTIKAEIPEPTGPPAGNETTKLFIACLIIMLGVSTVFITQSIFLKISQSFGIDFNPLEMFPYHLAEDSHGRRLLRNVATLTRLHEIAYHI